MKRYIMAVLANIALAVVMQANCLFDPYSYQGGKLLISGTIACSDTTSTIPSLLQFPISNLLTGTHMNQMVEVDENGKFSGELTLPHPVTLNVDRFGEILMLPGDTLSLWTDTATGEVRMEGSDGAIRYHRDRIGNKNLIIKNLHSIQEIASDFTREEIQELFDTVAAGIDRYLASHPADTTIRNRGERFADEIIRLSPVSNALNYIYTIADIYGDRKFTRTADASGKVQMTFNRDFVPLDFSAVTETVNKYPSDITCNPALLLADRISDQLIMRIELQHYGIGLSVVGKMFDIKDEISINSDSACALSRPFVLPRDYSPAIHNLQVSTIGTPYTMADEYRILFDRIVDAHGYDITTLLGQICLSRHIMNHYFPDDKQKIWLDGDRMEGFMAAVLPLFTDQTILRQLIHAYREFVKETDITAVNVKTITPTLEKIIAPYEGEALFVDFWGFGCGPCRAGMLRQRETVADFANRPIRFLYIAQDDSDRIKCEKWMAENNIGGEHIFIAPDDWKRLETELNFNAIPFKILIDRSHSTYHNPKEVLTQDEMGNLLEAIISGG